MDSLFISTGAFIVIAGLLYYLALPRPLPGIPFDPVAARSPLGDIPSLVRDLTVSKDLFQWMWRRCYAMRSPVFQIFLWPFGRPMIICTDYEEIKDIVLRRTPREFDRSPMDDDFIQGIAPYFTLTMATHEDFKTQRSIFIGTMSPSFLRNVAAPRLREAAIELIKHWREKTRLADGKAFQAERDLKYGTFDAMWRVAFGRDSKTFQASTDYLAAMDRVPIKIGQASTSTANIQELGPTDLYESFTTLLNSLENIRTSPFPRLHHLMLRQYPSMQKALKIKNRCLDEALVAARDPNSADNASDGEPTSAMAYVLQTQSKVLEKTGSTISEAALRDELFGYLIAGFETSANTLAWTVKFLAAHKDVQTRLRDVLQTMKSEEGVIDRHGGPIYAPSASNLSDPALSYLDAVIEEVLHKGQTVPMFTRIASKDTTLLGHAVPKGTNIFFLHNGNLVIPPEDMTDEERKRVGARDDPDLSTFRPDRWLTKNESSGVLEFDPSAGKHLPFSGGVRGCFGKRLAYQQMRVILALLILNFELDAPPAPYDNFEGYFAITRVPKHCFIRATPLYAP